ncbi:MAG: methyltransferase [Christensenella sp.]
MTMERIDDLQLKGLRIIQDSDLFCFGTDAVLLADFAHLCRRARVADLGTGTGILPLLLFGRREDITVQAIELQDELFALARRSVDMNGLGNNIQIVHGNIKAARALLDGVFDTVVSNPPYEQENAGIHSGNESHRIARFEVAVTFEELCVSARELLRSGGRFECIHRSSRSAELFTTLKKHGLEPKDVRFIHSFAHSPSAQVLISAVKDGREGINVMPPLIVHNDDGTETAEVRKIYHRENEE